MSFSDEQLTNEQLSGVPGGSACNHFNNSYDHDPPYYLITSPDAPACPGFDSIYEADMDYTCGVCKHFLRTVELDLCTARTEQKDPYA